MTKERISIDKFTICIDNGYWNPELLKEISKPILELQYLMIQMHQEKKKKLEKKNKLGKRQEQINKAKKNKDKPKRIQKYQFRYISKEDAFEYPKTKKKLFPVVDIVTLTGVQKKKYTYDYCQSYDYKSQCT